MIKILLLLCSACATPQMAKLVELEHRCAMLWSGEATLHDTCRDCWRGRAGTIDSCKGPCEVAGSALSTATAACVEAREWAASLETRK